MIDNIRNGHILIQIYNDLGLIQDANKWESDCLCSSFNACRLCYFSSALKLLIMMFFIILNYLLFSLLNFSPRSMLS